eukprot:jgi/Chlat1/2045/Chrsp17S02515
MLGIQRGLERGRRALSKGLTQLTSKRGGKDFFKGKGCVPAGQHTRKGGYVLQHWNMPRWKVPDLTGFELKPYVSKNTPKLTVSPPQTASPS